MSLISLNIAEEGFNYPSGSDWLASFGELDFLNGGDGDQTGTTIINGCLLLEGNLTSYSDIHITNFGKVIPVPDEDLKKSFYSLQTSSYTTANGGSRTMTSTTGDINVDGLIDGEGQGFESNRGPGCNSLLTDSCGNELPGYGASHAGLGFISD